MATSYLRMSDDKFWDMEPRILFSQISEWQDIENGRAIIMALAANGQELPGSKKSKEKVIEDFNVHPDCF